jgi:hypothetical protein
VQVRSSGLGDVPVRGQAEHELVGGEAGACQRVVAATVLASGCVELWHAFCRGVLGPTQSGRNGFVLRMHLIYACAMVSACRSLRVKRLSYPIARPPYPIKAD